MKWCRIHWRAVIVMVNSTLTSDFSPFFFLDTLKCQIVHYPATFSKHKREEKMMQADDMILLASLFFFFLSPFTTWCNKCFSYLTCLTQIVCKTVSDQFHTVLHAVSLKDCCHLSICSHALASDLTCCIRLWPCRWGMKCTVLYPLEQLTTNVFPGLPCSAPVHWSRWRKNHFQPEEKTFEAGYFNYPHSIYQVISEECCLPDYHLLQSSIIRSLCLIQ